MRAPEGTADVGGAGAGYGLRSSCVVGYMPYAHHACMVSRSPQGLAKIKEVTVEVCRAFAFTVSANETRDHVYAPTAYTADDGAS